MPMVRARLIAAVIVSALAGSIGATGLAAGQAPAASQTTAPNAADVHFMSGMIPHHAQAVVMAGWAPSHGARRDVRILSERIVVAQRDEIALMQTWLAERGLPVPSATATHHTMKMGEMEHKMLMPGMLSDEEMARLDKARGPEFDKLFLTFMIKHHEGAPTMVDELYKADGAAQDEMVFRFASDVYADQQAEIERMQFMLGAGGFHP
jgi:uncharacterized protein (DUF305 family)